MDRPPSPDDAVVQIDADGRVVLATPAATALVGPNAVLGVPIDAWLDDADREGARALLARMSGGEMAQASVRVAGTDAHPLWMSLRPDAQVPGRILGRIHVDRRSSEALNEPPTAEADRLRLLAVAMAQSGVPFHDHVRQVLALTSTLLGFEIGILSRIEGAAYTVVACHAPDIELEAGAVFDLGDTYCSITLEGRDLLEIGHMATSAHRRHPCYAAFQLESYVGTPILVGGEVWGTLNFSAAAPRAHALTEADRSMLRLLAVWVGGAVERKERAEALAAQGRQLDAVVRTAPVILYALDREGRFTLSTGRGLGALGVETDGLVGLNVFEAYADVPEALENLRAALAGEERTWQVDVGPASFESWAAPILDADGRVTGVTGVSVDVTALHQAERQVRREAHRLRRFLNATSAAGTFEENAQAVLDVLADLLGMGSGLLARVEDGTYTCLARASQEGATLAPGDELPLGETYCDLTIAAGDVVAIEDMATSEHRAHPCYEAVGMAAYIGVPVEVDGAVFGALSFSSPTPAEQPFTEGDRQFMRLAARWAGGLVERDLRERHLSESERRLRALSDAAFEAIAFTREGRIIDCNEQMAWLFGYATADDLVGRSALEFCTPEYAPKVRQMIAENRPEPYEVLGLRRDGSTFWGEVQGRSASTDGQDVRITAIRDVTARKRAEEHRRFQADVLAHVSDAVVALDLEGRITYWNAGAAQLHGHPAHAVLGTPLEDVVQYVLPDESGWTTRDAARSPESVLQSQAAANGELIYVGPDGQRRFVSVSSSVIRDDDGVERGLLAVSRDVTDQRELAARLRHQATHDVLTGLPNRALFRQRIEEAIGEGAPFAVLFIDLDRFKVINDSLGHGAGDRLLTTVALRLREALGASEGALIARLGGDEFGVVSVTADGEAIGRAVLRALQAPVDLGPRAVAPAASVGIVVDGQHYDAPEDLLRDADTAMYAAKHGGRSQLAVFDPGMHAAAALRFGMEHDLRHAIDRGELRLHFQPIVDLRTGAVAGFEALVRWAHPEHGLLAPGQFIPLAEEINLVADVDRWVLEETCRTVGAWGPEAAGIFASVNCSDQAFLRQDLADAAWTAAHAAGLPPERLVLELTERALVEADAARSALAALHARGLQLSVDDFGAGFSSLGLLHTLPVDGIKIDRSFMGDLEGSREARAVVRAVVRLSDDLGLRTIAEGVETPGQLRALQAAGARFAQGYLLARPVPPDEARRMLAVAPWAADWAAWTADADALDG